MKRPLMRRVASLLMLALVPVFAGAAGARSEATAVKQAVVATLTLPHATVLPGVPFDIVVTLKNVSDRPAMVGLIARLVVTFPDGSMFVGDGPNDHWALQPKSSATPRSIELGPGESTQRVVSLWDLGSIPNWSRYGSFTGPGTYDIALDLSRGMRDETTNYVGTIRSSTARLQRVVPVGEDEALWLRMQAVGGPWSDDAFKATKAGHALAEEIVQLHPASGYLPLRASPFQLVQTGTRHRSAARGCAAFP